MVCVALREGRQKEMLAEELVPGDIVQVQVTLAPLSVTLWSRTPHFSVAPWSRSNLSVSLSLCLTLWSRHPLSQPRRGQDKDTRVSCVCEQ